MGQPFPPSKSFAFGGGKSRLNPYFQSSRTVQAFSRALLYTTTMLRLALGRLSPASRHCLSPSRRCGSPHPTPPHGPKRGNATRIAPIRQHMARRARGQDEIIRRLWCLRGPRRIQAEGIPARVLTCEQLFQFRDEFADALLKQHHGRVARLPFLSAGHVPVVHCLARVRKGIKLCAEIGRGDPERGVLRRGIGGEVFLEARAEAHLLPLV